MVLITLPVFYWLRNISWRPSGQLEEIGKYCFIQRYVIATAMCTHTARSTGRMVREVLLKKKKRGGGRKEKVEELVLTRKGMLAK